MCELLEGMVVLWAGPVVLRTGVGTTFQCFTVALVPKMYINLQLIRFCAISPLGSSNAKTIVEAEPGLYVPGGQTQLGCCVMLSVAYTGLSFTSASWHSSRVQGPRLLETPVGTLLTATFDHLTFAVICRA